jgi:hypothetical protein
MKYFILIFLTFPLILQAQISGGFGHVSIGNQQLKHTPINQVHKDYGFSTFNPSALTVSGTGFGVIKGFMIGGEGAVIASSQLEGPNFSSSLAAAYGMIQIGFLPNRFKYFLGKTLVYPVVGFGRGGSAYSLRSQAFFSNELDIKANSEQTFMKLELNVAFFPFTRNKPDKHGGILSAMSVGYLFNPSSTSFKQDNDPQTPLPTGTVPPAYTSGWFLKFSFGGGGLGKKATKG